MEIKCEILVIIIILTLFQIFQWITYSTKSDAIFHFRVLRNEDETQNTIFQCELDFFTLNFKRENLIDLELMDDMIRDVP